MATLADAGSYAGLITTTGFSYMSGLDPLRVSFMLRALQAHRDSKSLAAPKITVLSGESASFVVQTNTVLPLPPEVISTIIPGGVSGTGTTQSLTPRFLPVQTGTTLNITPIISPDKKHVLLNITTWMNDLLGTEKSQYTVPMPDGTVATYTQELPETENSQVQTRVSVPDGGTLLLGGQKLTEEIEIETGVPVLSKIPVLGRLFSSRSKVKDQKILLILVRPTIILQEEVDAKALAAMESSF